MKSHGKAGKRKSNASISRGWDSASEWYRARVLDSVGVKDSATHSKQSWKSLPAGVKRAVTGRPARNYFDTARERAAYAAGLAHGGAGMAKAAETLRRKKATRVERMMRSGLGRR